MNHTAQYWIFPILLGGVLAVPVQTSAQTVTSDKPTNEVLAKLYTVNFDGDTLQRVKIYRSSLVPVGFSAHSLSETKDTIDARVTRSEMADKITDKIADRSEMADKFVAITTP